MQKPRNTFLGIVVLGVLPNHPHSIEETRKEIWYFLWRGCLQLLTWLIETLQEVQVILCLHRPNLYVLSYVFEGLNVLRVYVCEYLDDAFEFWLIQLLVDMGEVVLPTAPVCYLIQWTCIFIVLLRVLVIDYVLDLPVPVKECSL